jgi:hypothetical protein
MLQKEMLCVKFVSNKQIKEWIMIPAANCVWITTIKKMKRPRMEANSVYAF